MSGVAAAAAVRKTLGVDAKPRAWRTTVRGWRSFEALDRRKIRKYEKRAVDVGYQGHTDRYDREEAYRVQMDTLGWPRVFPDL